MSEQENPNPSPPRPTAKTSAVPLKKETVRITLRPQSPEAAEAPPPPAVASPAASAPPPPRPTVPLAPPPRPGVPGAPPPVAGGPPRPAPPPSPVGSKTIPLSQPPARPTTPMVGKQTTRITGGAPTTQPLPRATVKLQPTSLTPAAPVSSVSIRTSQVDDDEEIDEGPLNIMGWVALVGSIAALIGVLSCMDSISFFSEGIVRAEPGKESRSKAIASWRDAPAPDGIKLPMDFSPFDRKDGQGGIESNYRQLEPDIPVRPPAP